MDFFVDHWDFDDRESYSFSLKEDGKELASLQTETYDEGRHGIFDIEVDKKHRRKGLATKLYNYAKNYLKNLGIELVHSNNLSDEGRNWKNSLAGKYRWKPNKQQREEFKKRMQDPNEQAEYLQRKKDREQKRRDSSKFDYQSAGGNYVPTETQYEFCMRNSGKGTDEQQDAMNILISGFLSDEKVPHDYIHIVNEMIRGGFDKTNNIKFVYLNKNNIDGMKNIKAIKNSLKKNSGGAYEDWNNPSSGHKPIPNSYTNENGNYGCEDCGWMELDYPVGFCPECGGDVVNLDVINKLEKKSIDKEHLKEDSDRFKNIDKEADDIKDEVDELQKDDKSLEKKSNNYPLQGNLIFDINNVTEVCEKIRTEINLPLVYAQFSTLGGDEHVSIMPTLCWEERDNWKGGYIENSKFARFSIERDGVIECFQKSKIGLKFRKTKAKTIDQVIEKLNNYVNQVNSQDIVTSAIKKTADSKVSADAWVQAWIDRYTVESDEQVDAILKSDFSRDEKERQIAERIKQMLNEVEDSEYDIKQVSNETYEVDWNDVSQILDDYEDDIEMSRDEKEDDELFDTDKEKWLNKYTKKISKKQLSVPEQHQKNIALKTLKMNDAMVGVMGGMNKQEAREFLKSIGYTDDELNKLSKMKKKSISMKDLTEFVQYDSEKWHQKFINENESNLQGDWELTQFINDNKSAIIKDFEQQNMKKKSNINNIDNKQAMKKKSAIPSNNDMFEDITQSRLRKTIEDAIKHEERNYPDETVSMLAVCNDVYEELEDLGYYVEYDKISNYVKKNYPELLFDLEWTDKMFGGTNPSINKPYRDNPMKRNMKKKSKKEFPNSTNSIIRHVTVWENGNQSEIINNYNYEEDLTNEGIPFEWDYKTLPQAIMDYAFDSGSMDDLGDDYDFGGMDIGFIGNGTTTVNMFSYDEKLNITNERKIETIGSYEEGEPLIAIKNKQAMKKISVTNHLGHEDVYDLSPELLVSLSDITADIEEEMYPPTQDSFNQINTNQSKEVIESQLTEQINMDYPKDLTYESIFQCAINTGLVDNMDRYNIIGILNNVAINFGLPRTSWDDFFPNTDIIEEIDLNGTDSSISFDEDGEFSANDIINNYDNEADDLFVIDRILDERLKHFIDTDQLIDESVDVVKSSMNNIKRKQAYVKKYRLNKIRIGDTDGAGRIINGDISYNIRLRSMKQRDIEKVIEVVLPIKARRIEMPKTFKYKQEEFPLENYYISDILEN